MALNGKKWLIINQLQGANPIQSYRIPFSTADAPPTKKTNPPQKISAEGLSVVRTPSVVTAQHI